MNALNPWLQEACRKSGFDQNQTLGLTIQVRLHSAIGYVAPTDKLAGGEPAIFAERDRKLDEARERRRAARRIAWTAVA